MYMYVMICPTHKIRHIEKPRTGGQVFTLQMSRTAAQCGTAADSDMLRLAMGET